ncbi:MAG: DUF4258 domain-containing protein [Anaerosomatales bacterium]|nr:DUF4258 domain-containing protein [Coriobacteriia bacterium]
MAESRKPPDGLSPIAFIRVCLKRRRVFWTYHANMRLAHRLVTRGEIHESAESYELIEAYPDDKYLPSYLVLAQGASDPLHVLFAIDRAGDNVRVVTAYRPNPDEWAPDFKTRRAAQ